MLKLCDDESVVGSSAAVPNWVLGGDELHNRDDERVCMAITTKLLMDVQTFATSAK